MLPFVIDEIDADGTLLQVLPKNPAKQPLVFDLARLTLHSAGANRAMSFRATLTNPKPSGQIETTGEFGSFDTQEPSQTPVSGGYTFRNADPAIFRGIAGILSSEGKYKGVLERIEVDGATDTPDFMLTVARHPIGLKTEFHAIVDGTDGDTLLQPVNGKFLRTSVATHGGVTGTAGVKGKTVSLDAGVTEGRVEDVLRPAVKAAKPAMTGALNFRAKIEIPPGEADVIHKLVLGGHFGMGAVKFTNLNVQEKVNTLSDRSRGEAGEPGVAPVVSNLKGRFVLKNAVAMFSGLTFRVPGADVQLSGSYGLENEALDFRGTLRMQAKLSETTTGVKSFLLKALDPFFKKKKAGAVIPIKITGTREQPSFGLNFGGKR